jgi:hypothetical protein
MVLDIIEIFVDALSGFVTAVGEAMLEAFDLLVYNPDTGLTGIATWSLVFGAIALVLGIVSRFTRA